MDCLLFWIVVGLFVLVISSDNISSNDPACVDLTSDCTNAEALKNICRSPSMAKFCQRSCQLCPINGHFTTWSSWTPCSMTCGNGTTTRQRSCSNPAPSNGGQDCEGTSSETVSCNNGSCTKAINGGWGSWLSWSPCTTTCGRGLQLRQRLCNKPTPSNGGANCIGKSWIQMICNPGQCPVNGEWGSWQSWSSCSKTCGLGRQLRQRKCDHPPPTSNGAACPGVGMITKICNLTRCPPDCSSLKADIVFIVDASGSVRVNNFRGELLFVEDIVQSLSIGPKAVQVGFIAFSSNVYETIHLNRYWNKTSLISAIKHVQYNGMQTYTSAALKQANNDVFTARNGDRDDAKDLIVLLTDGISNTPADTYREVKLLRSRGIEIMVVAIGNSAKSEVHSIASSSGDVFALSNFQSLDKSLTKNILYSLCDDVTPCGEWGTWSECSVSCGQGFRTRHKICKNKRFLFQRPVHQTSTATSLPLIPLQVSSNSNTTEIQHSPCHIETNCTNLCTSIKKDVVFAIDRTNSISFQEYKNETQFVNDIIRRLVIGPDHVQISAIGWPSPMTSFWLNKYNRGSDIEAAISRMRLSGGQSYIGNALALARTQIFQARHGDRPDARNLLIVITDGKARDHSQMLLEAKHLHTDGVTVATVGIENAYVGNLQEMASRPDLIFHTNSFATFGSLVDNIVTLICQST